MLRYVATLFLAGIMWQNPYDLVIQGGRVLDPETGLDAVRNIGIRAGTIARITSEPLNGARVLDAKGLVVAPGFVDLHSHGQDQENYRLKAQDGVTTVLEMEIGVADVPQYLREREGRSLVNFGIAASHPFTRVKALGGKIVPGAIVPQSSPQTDARLTPEQPAQIKDLLRQGIDAGALGIGMGIAYTPGATRFEVIEIFRLAAEKRVPVFVHLRASGPVEPDSSIASISELIAASAISGASLHIVHMNSSGGKDALRCLGMVEGARARGLDVTTEAYPYIAGMTAINSGVFNPGWQERTGVDYKALQLVETGERLTKESFDRLRALSDPKLVIVFQNTDEMVDAVITHPLAMIASDGHMANGKGHPRGAGTFSRILARYVRTQRRLTLMDAVRKMSLMPAQRLERVSSAARRKGRIQEGADADIVVFDPETVEDRATYSRPAEPSVGYRFVLVAGTPVVQDGKVVENVAPGRALIADLVKAGKP
jgi:N-acyl-D-aspartate/D-glutamate deacylase